jgi:hypothetical protein
VTSIRGVVAVLMVAALAASVTVRAAADAPPAVKQGIEAVLQKRAEDLSKEKNEQGKAFRRGRWSSEFSKVDDATWLATFYRDTADKGAMKTERMRLTMRKEASGWTVAEEKVEDTYAKVWRVWPDDFEVYTFDRLTFDREGLKVSSGPGALATYRVNAKTVGFVAVGENLAQEYVVPPDLDFFQAKNKVIIERNKADFVFKPEYVEFECDPESCADLLANVVTGASKAGEGRDGMAKLGGAPLARVWDREMKKYQERLDANPFSDFDVEEKPDRRRVQVLLKRDSAKDVYVFFLLDNYEPRDVQYGAFPGYGAIFGYHSQQIRKSGIPPYDLETREDPQARLYEIDALEGYVDIAQEDPEALTGDLKYVMTIKQETSELPFAILQVRFNDEEKSQKSPKLSVHAIQDEKGNDLTWTRLGGSSGIVVFPAPIPAGTRLKLRMKFTSRDSIIKLTPTYSYMDRSGWLPFVRFADMIDKFDLTVKAPSKYKVLGIGGKVSETRDGNATVTRWVAESPVNFPTIIFGDYIEEIPSFKATKLDGTEIPVIVHVDKTSLTDWEIRPKQLKAIADQAANAINLFREVFGVDYPYAKLDLVNDPLGFLYGQSPASIVYLGSGVFRGEGSLGVSTGESSITKFLKDVVAHEVAHQWWGSTITNANDGNYWFVESLAEFSSAVYVENVYGRDKYLEKIQEWRKTILERDVLQPVQSGYTLWSGESPFGAVQANIYNKGPYAFHMLRLLVGDDKKFFESMKALAQDLKGEEIVTRDIQQSLEKALGGSLEWFFDQWIRGVGTPQYALNWTTRQTEDGKWLVEGTIKQRVIYGKEKIEIKGKYYKAAAPLTFVAHSGKKFKSKPILVEGAETPFRLKIADEPAEVKFNEDGEILSQDVLVNRAW